MSTYSLVLKSCPDEVRDAVAQVLARAFSLKDATSASITLSTPIVLVSGMNMEEAASLMLAVQPITTAGGVVEFSNADLGELPKIDWPKRPSIFKREIADHVIDFQVPLRCPACQRSHRLVDMLVSRLTSISGGMAVGGKGPQEFKGSHLPEVTPFSNVALKTPVPSSQPMGQASGGDDALSRLNEMFPDEGSSFIPNDEAITNLLDRLLPDEEGSTSVGGQTGANKMLSGDSSRKMKAVGGYAVFLAKITDENRRTKSVPLIAELAKITEAEADIMSKKPIIPVLKAASKEDAEAAKAKFAKIGILARIKAPE